jgi:adenosylcobyric acid synthase
MKNAKSIMLQGTGSGVGKSLLVSALCRIFLDDGMRPVPFKSQNMALNSFVTEKGGEIGRAQAAQAMAAKLKPTVDMNPVLLKPTADRNAQVIVHGKPVGNMSVYGYKEFKETAFKKVKSSYKKLKNEYDVVVIEGAGSPAEINLKEDDIVNMKMAAHADAPVILIGDIDKGGVFAWLIGTLQLLDDSERKRVKGLIINKFRGDKRLLRSGITYLEKYTGIKVLGVVPYLKNINIPEEDSVPMDEVNVVEGCDNKIKIDVVYLPHISNFTDFDALAQEDDVDLNYIKDVSQLKNPDMLIIPGTKNTIGDLGYLKKNGFTKKIRQMYKANKDLMIVGICGGYQILGEKICDGGGVEAVRKKAAGLGLLPVETVFSEDKTLSQVEAVHVNSGLSVKGYEIHHGITSNTALKPLFKISGRKKYYDGAVTVDGRCWGTYIHGVFDSDAFRRHVINSLRVKKGLGALGKTKNFDVDKEFQKLAREVRKNLNMKALYKIIS